MNNWIDNRKTIIKWLGIVVLLYFLIASIGLVGGGFKLATGGFAKELLVFAKNPLAGLFVGILVTSLVQSSSTVTSLIVGLVAGGLPIETAIPLIFGANIGTSITSTLVSLNFNNKKEFKLAFQAATVHDFFNLCAVILIFPLEMTTHFLEKISFVLATALDGTALGFNIKDFNIIKKLTKPLTNAIKHSLEFLPHPLNGLVMIGVGAVIVFVSILLTAKLLKHLMVGRVRDNFVKAVGTKPITSIVTGTITTILVQSSSTTTSLIVPFASQGLVKLKSVYTFILGANIGTCITALIASTGALTNTTEALQIALIHLLFNITGILLVYGIPALRKVPIILAKGLSEVAAKKKYLAFTYLIGTFFLLPGILLMFSVD